MSTAGTPQRKVAQILAHLSCASTHLGLTGQVGLEHLLRRALRSSNPLQDNRSRKESRDEAQSVRGAQPSRRSPCVTSHCPCKAVNDVKDVIIKWRELRTLCVASLATLPERRSLISVQTGRLGVQSCTVGQCVDGNEAPITISGRTAVPVFCETQPGTRG